LEPLIQSGVNGGQRSFSTLPCVFDCIVVTVCGEQLIYHGRSISTLFLRQSFLRCPGCNLTAWKRTRAADPNKRSTIVRDAKTIVRDAKQPNSNGQ